MTLQKRLAARCIALCACAFLALAPAPASQAPIVTPETGPMSMQTFTTNWLNPALLALMSCHSGSSAPTDGPGSAPLQYQCWIDTSASPSVYKIYDGASWLAIGTIDTAGHAWLLGSATIPPINLASTSNGGITGTLPVSHGGTNAGSAGPTAANNIGALAQASNLSDLANAATARANLGVTASGADATYAFRANNLSDLASAATARTNLGVTATGADTTYAFRANNLSDLASISTARTNLGLGTIALLNAINNGNWSGTALALGNGGSGATSSASARVNFNVEGLTSTGDANYTILSSDRMVTHTALSAARTDTLPAANSVNAGQVFVLNDFAGVASATKTLTLQRAGSDTINGLSSVVAINAQYGAGIFWSDGASKWTFFPASSGGGGGTVTGITAGPGLNGGTVSVSGTFTAIPHGPPGGRLTLQSGQPIPTQDQGTTTISTTTGQVALGANLMIVDRTAILPNKSTINTLGLYSTSAHTFTMKIVKRNSAGNYDIVASQSFSHPGGGWADMTISSAFTVPATGRYYPGAFVANTTTDTDAGCCNKAQASTDLTGTGQTMTESTGGGVFPMRFTQGPATSELWFAPCAGLVPTCGGPFFPHYDGTNLVEVNFLSSATDNVGLPLILHTGVETAGNLYDAFLTVVSGTPVLGHGPAYSNSGAGTSARSAALQSYQGYPTNASSMTLNYDNGGGASTFTCPANQCLFAGTFLATENGKVYLQIRPTTPIGGPNAIVGLCNTWNRVPIRATAAEGVGVWTYASSTWRDVNGSANNAITFIDCLGTDQIVARYGVSGEPVASGSPAAWTPGIGWDQDCTSTGSESDPLAGFNYSEQGASTISQVGGPTQTIYTPYSSLGLHKVVACEVTTSVNTTFNGLDNPAYAQLRSPCRNDVGTLSPLGP